MQALQANKITVLFIGIYLTVMFMDVVFFVAEYGSLSNDNTLMGEYSPKMRAETETSIKTRLLHRSIASWHCELCVSTPKRGTLVVHRL